MGAEEWAKSFLDIARTVMDNLNRMTKTFGKFPLAALDMLGNMVVLAKPLVSKLMDWLRNEFIKGGKEAGKGMTEGIKEGMSGASAETSEHAKALAERNKLAQGATTRDALGYIFGKKGTTTEKVVNKDKQAAEDAKKNAEAQAETATAMNTVAEAAQNTAKANEEVGDSAENAAKKAQEQAQALENQANATTSVDAGASAAEGAIRDVASASNEAAEAAKKQAQETKNLNEALSETPTASNATAPADTGKKPAKTRRRAMAQAQQMMGKDTEETAQETTALNENAEAARNAAEAREALNNAEATASATTASSATATDNSTQSLVEQEQAAQNNVNTLEQLIAKFNEAKSKAEGNGQATAVEGWQKAIETYTQKLEEAKQKLAQLQAQMGNTGTGTAPVATPTGNEQPATTQTLTQSPVSPETTDNLDRAGKAAEGFGHRLINAYNASSALGSSITSMGMAIKLFTTLIDTSTVSGKKWAGSITFIGSAIMAVNTAMRIAEATAKGLAISGGMWLAIASGIIGMINGIATFVETTSEKIERLTKEAEELKNIQLEVKDTEKNLTSGINKVKELEEARYESAEAAEEYQTAVDQLADAFPELISGFDTANNIMIDITNAEEVLALARKKTLQATLDAAEGEIKKNEAEIQGAKDNIRTNASIFNGTDLERGNLSPGYDVFDDLLQSSVEQKQYDEIMEMVADLSQKSDYSDFEKVSKKVDKIFTSEKISNLDDTSKKAYDILFGSNGYITLIKEGYAQIEALDKANQGYAKSAISADLNNRDQKYNEESKYLNRLRTTFIQAAYEADRQDAEKEGKTLLYETWREGQENLFNTTSKNLQSFWDSLTLEGQSDFDRMMSSKETYSAQAFYDKFGITEDDELYQAFQDMYDKDAENIKTRMINNIQGGSDKEKPAEGTNLSKLYETAKGLKDEFITIYTESIISQATSTINSLESHGLFDAASDYVDNITKIFDLVKDAFKGDAYGADNFIKQLSSYELNSQEGIDNAIAYVESLPNAENYTQIIDQLKALQGTIVSDLTSEIDAIKSNIQGSFDNALKNIDKATKGVGLSDAMEVFDQISAVLGEKLDFNKLFTQDPNELGKYILKDANKINEVYDKLAEKVRLRVENLRGTLDEAEGQVSTRLEAKTFSAKGDFNLIQRNFNNKKYKDKYDNVYDAFYAESSFAQANSEFLEALEELNLTTAFQEYLESGDFDKFKKAIDEAIAGKEADYAGVEAYLNELETIQPAMMQAAAGNITEAIRQIWQLAVDATKDSNSELTGELQKTLSEDISVWDLFQNGTEKLEALRQADIANSTNYYSNVITMMEQASASMNNFWKDILSQGWDKAFNNLASYNLDSSLEDQIREFSENGFDGFIAFFNQFATSMGLVAGSDNYFSAYASALEADNKRAKYNQDEAVKALKYTQNAGDAYFEATVDQMMALAKAYGLNVEDFNNYFEEATGTYHLTEAQLEALGVNNVRIR